MKNGIENYAGKSLNRIPDNKKNKEKKEKHRIPLTKYTEGGRISSLLAIAAFLVIAFAITISILMHGKAGIYVGIMMLGALAISVVGFWIGIKSFEEENKFLRYTFIGTIANAAIWICILGMYLIYI